MFTSKDKSLTKENILKRVNSYQLFRAYCSGFTGVLDAKFSSELRNDPKPSCAITVYKGDLFYRDYGQKRGMRVFDYIGEKFNIDHYSVLQKINKDFGLELGYSKEKINPGVPLIIPEVTPEIDYTVERKAVKIDIKVAPWTKKDELYWGAYKIPLKLLEYHNIKAISHYWITNPNRNKDNVCYAVNDHALAYSYDYYWNEGIFRRKLYFPSLNPRIRSNFISNVDSTIVQGWTLLPKNGGEILFITKSYKDILIFNLLGYWAIAPNNEGAYIPDIVMEKLKRKWKHILVWYDNDQAGIEKAPVFAEKFGLKWTHNPIDEPKDPSDYVKKYNLSQFDFLINKFLSDALTK